MSWFTRIFGGTWLGRGMWHGKEGHPTEEHYREMDSVKADLENVNKILKSLATVNMEDTHLQSGSKDDYGEIIHLLRPRLKEQGVPDEKLDHNTVKAICRVLGRIVSQALTSSESRTPMRYRLSFLEAEYVNIAEEKISRLHERWSKKKNKLESKAKRIQHHFDDVLEEYNEYHRKHEEKGYRLPARMFSPFWYGVFMLTIAVGEFFFNLQAFQILRVPGREVYFIALAPSLAFPLLAHFLGTKLRQGFLPGEKRKRSIVAVSISTVCIFLGVVGVTILRWDYIRYQLGTQMSVWQMLAFFMINLLFLGGALIGAYLSHDPDRDLDTICKHKADLRKRLNRLWDKWADVAAEFDALRDTTLDRIQIVRDATRTYLDEYRHGVSLGRADGKVPPFFTQPVSDNLFMPRDLGYEIDLTPPPIERVLEQRERASAKSSASRSENVKANRQPEPRDADTRKEDVK